MRAIELRAISTKRLFSSLLAVNLCLVASSCGSVHSSSKTAPSLTAIELLLNSNSFSSKMFQLGEKHTATCMKRAGFRYQMQTFSSARFAGSSLYFSEKERKESGFGIALQFIPPERIVQKDQTIDFKKAEAICRKEQETKWKRISDIFMRFALRYTDALAKMRTSVPYKSFEDKYRLCMSQSGYPKISNPDEAFALVNNFAMTGAETDAIRAMEIPVAVADYECASKFQELRLQAFNSGQPAFLDESTEKYNELQKFLESE